MKDLVWSGLTMNEIANKVYDYYLVDLIRDTVAYIDFDAMHDYDSSYHGLDLFEVRRMGLLFHDMDSAMGHLKLLRKTSIDASHPDKISPIKNITYIDTQDGFLYCLLDSGIEPIPENVVRKCPFLLNDITMFNSRQDAKDFLESEIG